ncbi:transglutaminase-like cysteine peptidase [Colwellia echini]|uniref:Transglutaminase n=1 Tax=Colwellia echini TaxID=1982103 RepID=A0ABY3MUJ9_9GAMM|nr:transglutaminase-like cysteine peptidase [Colwellia echini]TYK64767.1 transglutaminase [Colwellia echini]
MKHIYTLLGLIFLIIAYPSSSTLDDFFSADFYQKLTSVYGEKAKKRAVKWHEVIIDNQTDNDWSKINKINYFFNNMIRYEDDLSLWGKKDYWASPVETVGRGKGDCEDFAIAKYFSLISLGIDPNKLRLMYVRQLTLNQPHMVLIYFESPKQSPFVLDNYNAKVLPASKRPDLKPIYSFNAQGLWLAKAKGLGTKVKNSKGVSAWNNLVQRIEQGEMHTFN